MEHMMRLLLVSLCTLCGGTRALGMLEEYPYVFAAVPLHAPVPVLRVLTRAPPPRPRLSADRLAAASSRYAAIADPLRHFAKPPHHYAAEPPREYAAAVDPLRHFAEPPRHYATEPSHPYAVGAPLRHFAEPPTRHYGGTVRQYAETAAEYETPQYSYSRPSYYPPPPLPPPRPEYSAAGDAEEVLLYTNGQRGEASGEAGAVLYARLSPTGGYTYRRAPARAAASDHHLRKAPSPAAPTQTKDNDQQYILKIHKYRIIKD